MTVMKTIKIENAEVRELAEARETQTRLDRRRMMEYKDIEAEIKKKCEKCGYSGKEFPHVVCHRPPNLIHYYRGNTVYATEAMVFTCIRCGYDWEFEVT